MPLDPLLDLFLEPLLDLFLEPLFEPLLEPLLDPLLLSLLSTLFFLLLLLGSLRLVQDLLPYLYIWLLPSYIFLFIDLYVSWCR